ncbi:MAG: hypothetical protein HGB26_05190 [Desulfobulbaceae bacterium]|nr:hypothetical protein [Desulfobulbaceae bacterium]
MDVYTNPIHSFSQDNSIGIGIKVYPGHDENSYQLHVGILYFHEYDDGSKKAHFCHLSSPQPNNLKDSPLSLESPSFWILATFDSYESYAIGAYCRAICDPKINNRTIPYGFSFRDNLFGLDGKWHGELGEGLTCATFVLAILHILHINILETNTWKSKPNEDIAKDEEWRLYVSRYCSEDVQMRLINGEISPRFRPEEVAVGANSEDRPLDYTMARKRGDQLIERLSNMR